MATMRSSLAEAIASVPSTTSAAIVACLSVANAFTVSRHASTSDSVCRGTTRLYQRTLGFETPGYSRAEMELQKKQTEVEMSVSDEVK